MQILYQKKCSVSIVKWEDLNEKLKYMGANGIPFYMAPNKIARDLTISDRAHRLYSILATHKDDWEISISHVSTSLNVSRSTAKRVLNELLESGWITRKEKKKGSLSSGYFYYLEDENKKKS